MMKRMKMNNVISFVNAGKRRYGENHWFWAVWIGALEISDQPTPVLGGWDDWDGAEPTESGFCESKRAARRAAWAALEKHIPLRSQRRAYQRPWARKYLWSQEEKDERPQFSRCKVGKNKWLWVVFRDGSWPHEEEPIARGFAKSADAAYEAAVEAVGPVRQVGNWMADVVRTKEAALKRSQRTTGTVDAAPLEFVYECHWYYSDYDSSVHDSITKHRIVKKTKKRIYVDRESWQEGRKQQGDWRDFQQRTFILDRQEFEENGKASRSKWWYGTYYADPAIYHAERRSSQYRPECFVVLDLPADAPLDVIQAAYRRAARRTHPDHGGNADEFKRVHAAYESALQMVVKA